jgi:hypothetical protein
MNFDKNYQVKDEKIKVKFLGFYFECTNPSQKSLIIIFMLLVFFSMLFLIKA